MSGTISFFSYFLRSDEGKYGIKDYASDLQDSISAQVNLEFLGNDKFTISVETYGNAPDYSEQFRAREDALHDFLLKKKEWEEILKDRNVFPSREILEEPSE